MKSGVVRVWGDAVLCYFWRGLAEIFILSGGIAVFQEWFSFFTSLVNLDVLYVVFCCFSVQFCRFQSPSPLTPHYIMADTGAFINVLNQEDYETREHFNEDSHLLIEEPTERSQKVKRIIGVKHQEDKHQALNRQSVV